MKNSIALQWSNFLFKFNENQDLHPKKFYTIEHRCYTRHLPKLATSSLVSASPLRPHPRPRRRRRPIKLV